MKQYIEKINKIMCWESDDGELSDQTFIRNGGRLDCIPSKIIIDIVYEGGLQRWADKSNAETQAELYNEIMRAMRVTVTDKVLNDKKRQGEFPPLTNFFLYCQGLDRKGKTHDEAKKIAELLWNTSILKRKVEERTSVMFSQKPDKATYDEIAEKIKFIYGFSDTDVDAIRYFVCQTRKERFNPSLCKSLYFWGEAKETGKTTIIRALVTILNGDKYDNFGKYESTIKKEMQYNEHDLPLGAFFNAVVLDEAMPKDTAKSYGQIKQTLTSNSCHYNQKFGSITHLNCNRFYLFGSNEDISEIVQDKTERRFYPIHMVNKPKSISGASGDDIVDDVYELWKQFCINCESEDDWHAWYHSFKNVSGVQMRDKDEVIQDILLSKETLFGIGTSHRTSVGVARLIFKNEPTREQKKSVRAAMEELFSDCRSDSNDSLYICHKCREKIKAIGDTNTQEGGVHEDLPF